MNADLLKCRLCPRSCGVDRSKAHGFCGVSDKIKVARAALHYWEEPCISGKKGSGAIFFSGCAMHCVYCQNRKISDGSKGEEISAKQLAGIFFQLAEQGAENINLVTGDHFIPQIAEAVSEAKNKGFDKPFIFNCSGYETVESLKTLDGLIDIYLPDFKYMEPANAKRYSNAPDYPDTAKSAIAEMVRQQPRCCFDPEGMMLRGVIVRNLLLPGRVSDSKKILSYLHEKYGADIYISIMSQYTPMAGTEDVFPELSRRVTKREYEKLVDYAIGLGIENAFIQDLTVAEESFIPDFDEPLITITKYETN